MLTFESAFWTEDLESELARYFLRRAVVSTFAAFVVILLVLVGPEHSVVLKVIPPIVLTIIGLGLWENWHSCRRAGIDCRKTGEICRNLLSDRKAQSSDLTYLRKVFQVVLDYSSIMVCAYPPPDELYERRKPVLDEEWRRVVAAEEAILRIEP